MRSWKAPRPLAAVLLFAWPLFVFAQPAADAAASVQIPGAGPWWVPLLLALISSGILMKVFNLAAEGLITWRAAKGDKKAQAYRELLRMARTAIGQVDADTKALRIQITSPDSDGGAAVTGAEARQLQDAALNALKKYTLDFERIKDLIAVVSGTKMLGEELDGFLRGIIQTVFDDKKNVENAALPYVGGVDPTAAALAKAGLTPRDPATASTLVPR